VNCEIDININAAGLRNIYAAGQFVTLVNAVDSIVDVATASGLGATIAWIVFRPFAKNVLTWSGDYYIYATTTALAAGNIVTMNTITSGPAQVGWTYILQSGQFSPLSSGTLNVFTAKNMTNGMFGFGLAQYATVNNTRTVTPMSAVSALFNQEILISSPTELFIFLSSIGSSGSVLYRVPDNALTLRLTGQAVTVSVGFNEESNTFYLGG
jgi:hypothetical protein